MFYESQRIFNKNKLHNNAYDLVSFLKDKNMSNQDVMYVLDLMKMTSTATSNQETIKIAQELVMKGIL